MGEQYLQVCMDMKFEEPQALASWLHSFALQLWITISYIWITILYVQITSLYVQITISYIQNTGLYIQKIISFSMS